MLMVWTTTTICINCASIIPTIVFGIVMKGFRIRRRRERRGGSLRHHMHMVE